MTTRPLRSTALLCSLCLTAAACQSSSPEPAEPEPKAAEPGPAKPAPAPPTPPPEGYVAHLADALAAVASGSAIATATPPAYGCSVKYADAGEPATAELGKPAPAFSLPDLTGDQVALADFAGKTVVLEWFNPGCPFVQYAHGEGPLSDLAARTVSDQVVWLAINSGAPGKQGHGVQANQEAAATWSMSHPILVDEDGTVGRAYGAKTTPQMFVIDAEGAVVYMGALDNAPFGKVEGTRQAYVEQALGQLAAGQPITVGSTKPYGCSVKY